MAKIGIFWVYRDTVIGKAIDSIDGDEFIAGRVDSPDTHIKLQEEDPDFIYPFSELRGSDYQTVPRGRVLFSPVQNLHIIFMDKVLFNKSTKQKIRSFFEIDNTKVSWNTDPHYTTELSDLDKCFDDF